jgi:pyruvate,water dikinase
MDDMILTLNRNIKRDTSLFGGKICGLISILEMGLPTPPGVIISSKLFSMVFENYFPQVKDDYSLENIQNIGLEKIRETLLDCEIPLSARMSIEARISIIEAPHGFSIRSSATNEDSTTTSMAGIFLTLLSQKNLTDVLSSLRQIWSSLFTELSLNYLRTMGITQLPKMAVLIQKQIYPDVSGVAFTTNPDSGNFREILINAACGMCSGVVGGISDTDTSIGFEF